MSLSSLANDVVHLLKKDGRKVEGLKASVQKSKIFMDAGNILVEPGDLILRKMSNGGEETYEVLDPGFYEKLHGIDAHYQMDVRKLGIPEAKEAVQSITFNITGHNTHINQHSVDNSTNVINIDARATQYVQELRQALDALEIDGSSKNEALEMLDEVDAQIKTGRPKKSVVSVLLDALPHVESITKIVVSLKELL